jgi:hypothetical protein
MVIRDGDLELGLRANYAMTHPASRRTSSRSARLAPTRSIPRRATPRRTGQSGISSGPSTRTWTGMEASSTLRPIRSASPAPAGRACPTIPSALRPAPRITERTARAQGQGRPSSALLALPTKTPGMLPGLRKYRFRVPRLSRPAGVGALHGDPVGQFQHRRLDSHQQHRCQRDPGPGGAADARVGLRRLRTRHHQAQAQRPRLTLCLPVGITVTQSVPQLRMCRCRTAAMISTPPL